MQLDLIILLNGLRTSRSRPRLEPQHIFIGKGQNVLELLQKSKHRGGRFDGRDRFFGGENGL